MDGQEEPAMEPLEGLEVENSDGLEVELSPEEMKEAEREVIQLELELLWHFGTLSTCF